MKDFRKLLPHEIECRVSQVTEYNGEVSASFLLYKDARCDMNILDETVGRENWQRKHTRDNANCIVSIWCDIKKQWIEKEDTGTESFTEKEKGLASDSFKRACFNWGIGRELYTVPRIKIVLTEKEYYKTGRKDKQNKDVYGVVGWFKPTVKEIEYNEHGEIVKLILNDRYNKRFEYNENANKQTKKPENTKGRRVKDSEPKKDEPTKENFEALLNLCDSLESLQKCWSKVPRKFQPSLTGLKDELKNKLE